MAPHNSEKTLTPVDVSKRKEPVGLFLLLEKTKTE